MGDLLFIDVARKQRDESLQELWDAYLAAREKSDHTRDISDGIAAGKAWARWLQRFTGKPS
jgi:hypothetical protein